MQNLRAGLVALICCLGAGAQAQELSAGDAGTAGADHYYPQLLGLQYTGIVQNQTRLVSPYQGPLSLDRSGDTQPTHTVGVYLGWAFTSWAQYYLDTEKFMGAGVSSATGLGGLTNGDVVREGSAGLAKRPYTARS